MLFRIYSTITGLALVTFARAGVISTSSTLLWPFQWRLHRRAPPIILKPSSASQPPTLQSDKENNGFGEPKRKGKQGSQSGPRKKSRLQDSTSRSADAKDIEKSFSASGKKLVLPNHPGSASKVSSVIPEVVRKAEIFASIARVRSRQAGDFSEMRTRREHEAQAYTDAAVAAGKAGMEDRVDRNNVKATSAALGGKVAEAWERQERASTSSELAKAHENVRETTKAYERSRKAGGKSSSSDEGTEPSFKFSSDSGSIAPASVNQSDGNSNLHRRLATDTDAAAQPKISRLIARGDAASTGSTRETAGKPRDSSAASSSLATPGRSRSPTQLGTVSRRPSKPPIPGHASAGFEIIGPGTAIVSTGRQVINALPLRPGHAETVSRVHGARGGGFHASVRGPVMAAGFIDSTEHQTSRGIQNSVPPSLKLYGQGYRVGAGVNTENGGLAEIKMRNREGFQVQHTVPPGSQVNKDFSSQLPNGAQVEVNLAGSAGGHVWAEGDVTQTRTITVEPAANYLRNPRMQQGN